MNDYSNDNLPIHLLSRKEYIDEFLSKRFHSPSIKKVKTKLYSPIDRCNFLYNLNKLKQSQLNEQIEERKKKINDKILNECTFTPKINQRKINYAYSTLSSTNYSTNKNNKTPNLDIIQRSEIWNQKKKEHINYLGKLKDNKIMKECYFTPEINEKNSLNKTHLKLKAIKLLEDPESYNQYVKRLQKKRNTDELLKSQNSFNGNNFMRLKKLPSNYDYRKHILSEKILPKSQSNKIMKTLKIENVKNVVNYNEINKDKYYEEIYLKNNSNTNFNNYYSKINTEYDNFENKESSNNENEKSFLFNNPIDYNQAKKILHNELFSFSILNEDEY